MKKISIALVLLLMFGLLTTTAALADVDDNDKPIVSVTPYLGYGFWSKDLGLDDSFMYGARGAVHVLKWLSVEGTYGRSGADRKLDGASVDLDHYGVDLVAELLPSAKFVPYLTAGWAQLDYKADGADRKQPLNGGEIGIGVKTRLGGNNANYRALRFDIRDVMTNLNPDFPNDNATTHNIVASLGVQFAFGKSSKDGDNDGVRDRDDECPDTPAGALTCEAGCPTDSDGDGVYDGLDKCSDTPAGAEIDADGCPIPEPVVELEVLDTGGITSTMVNFDLESSVVGGAYGSLIDAVGATVAEWPELRVEIRGHADDTGSAEYNQTLSEERAQSVLDQLKASYPDIADRCQVTGFGETMPIDDNSTDEGRANNRRVEFKVLNTGDLTR